MIRLELTTDEVNSLLQLLDAGLKNQRSGGLAMATIAATIMQKLQETQRPLGAIKPNGAIDSHDERDEAHG